MTEQNKELFHEFVEFCKAQPEDKVIDHSSWRTCAVGEFIVHKGISNMEEPYGYWNNEDTSELIEILGVRGNKGEDTLSRRLEDSDLPETYGEFTKLLETYL